MYVGQTARSKRRLTMEHGHAFRIGKKIALLYWISSRGDGESASRPSNRGFGLNVMPPLLQVLRLNPAQKTVWNIPIEVKDNESKGGEWCELISREDYAKAVVRAGPEDIAAKWVASTHSIVVPSDRRTFDSSMLRVMKISESPRAVDYHAVFGTWGLMNSTHSHGLSTLPHGDCQEASTFTTEKDNLLAETITSTHQILLETTNLKLVFLLGPDAELYALGPAKNLIKSVLELHGIADFIYGAESSFEALCQVLLQVSLRYQKFGHTRISGEAFEIQVVDDDVSTAVRKLQKEDPKSFQTSIDKVASQSDSQYKRALEISTYFIQKRVIKHEYNDMVNLKYFTCLIGDEAEALIDRIEEGAIIKKPSTFTIDTQFILASSSVVTRYLPSEPVSSIKRLNRPTCGSRNSVPAIAVNWI
ncbi:hypothetical protein OIDMADRAFT_23141 [Oidiodendron maius Zn]|uniref:Uncharacterized protein n=1 Tax=Oidiodendron maius (strain Zn) TaxID=913774 RepID=A0A0C3DAG3_OIDMZ|nr:hypothetical protein OIDMADRAFT_23141 [Oidiodendron maius Zn]